MNNKRIMKRKLKLIDNSKRIRQFNKKLIKFVVFLGAVI